MPTSTPKTCPTCKQFIVAKRPAGRPSLINPQLVEKICGDIRALLPTRVAARRAGVSNTTLFVWLEKGAKQKRGVYREFRNSIEGAEADRRALFAAQIAKAGRGTDKRPGDWRAMGYLAERFDPEEFGLRINVRVEEELGLGLERLAEEFGDDPETFERAVRALAGKPSLSLPRGNRSEEESSGGGAAPPAEPPPATPDPV